MHNNRITWLSLFPLSLVLIPTAQGAETVSPEQWLLEQIRVGEASHKEELVNQSLYRLELMDPNHPDVIAARMRLALRQGNQALAQQQLDKLKRLAPQSNTYRQAEMNMLLTQPETRQQLQQARLMATAGRLTEAKSAYDALFNGQPPTLDLSVEYWRLVARIPGQEPNAINKLQALDQRYPGSVQLRLVLARLLFSQKQDALAYEELQKVAADPAGRAEAADLWLEKIKEMPVSASSVAALQRYLSVFTLGERQERAREELARQETLLADPSYQARARGLALVDNGGSRMAIPALRKALAATPNDPELLGALGLAYARSGNRQQALTLFRQAQRADQSGYNSSKWQSLIQTNAYWLAVSEGDKALKANNLALAQQQYQQARRIDKTDSDALIGLGDVALARQDDAAAESYYQQALRIDPASSSAVRGLANLYQRQSPQKALAYLNSLPRSQQHKMRSTLDSLQLDILKQQAETLAQQQQWHQAVEKYQQAQVRAPNDVWLTYHYAQALRQAGQPQQADALFSALAQKLPDDPQQVYAYALYLSSSDRDRQALAHLATLPDAQWDDTMRELAQRLNRQAVLDHAEQLRAGGDEAAAIAYLKQQPASMRLDLTLADWALAAGDYDAALADYQRIRAREPNNPDARLGEIEAYVAQGKMAAARQRLQTADSPTDASVNSRRRVANAWGAVGEPGKALVIFSQLKTAVQSEPIGQSKALVYRDAAQLERGQGLPETAQQDIKQAMVASGITPTVPQDNPRYTRLMRNTSTDDWLQRGIRADAAELYRQQDVNVTLNHDYWGSSGTGGVSDYQAHDTMLQVDMPLYDGRAFFRTDTVRLDAGNFSTDSSGRYFETFGTCHTQGCRGDQRQKTTGTSVALGWQNARWAADLGTTPMGFEVVDWVGGLAYSGDWNHIGWTLGASRRPISSSLLAFGGTRDPNTGVTWGGVRATGVSLSGSYDRGEAHGVWADLSAHRLNGKNVADNQRERLMAGYYYKLINEDHRRATIGLNTMLWHYQKDLSGYSLGQGGYYSPQQYLSLAVPVNYRQRTENWSFEVGGSVSLSHSKTKDQRRYPLQGLIPDALADRDAIEKGSSSSGVGYTLRAVVERRLSSHWTLGAGVDIQQAKDYTPSHALIYLRYSLGGWQGDLDLPPQPLTPYADFK
ncbi:cellulose synthase complex outer membrane protein BcsC [Serratia sp. NPDC078593]|uniref:cellulose synthase complex outer membrane protein BcsC n=1 Tax=unclassified Serratia (in: enterobacteria) TaxID=2647522 RepID=UPI0037CCFEC6